MSLTRLSATLLVTDRGDFETDSDPDFGGDSDKETENDLNLNFDSDHIPKTQSDETEKDPEKFDSEEKASPEGGRVTRVLNVPAEFVDIKSKNNFSKKTIFKRLRDPEGYLLNGGKKFDGISYWHCTKCRVSAKTVGSTLEWIAGEHHHEETVQKNTKDEKRVLNIPGNFVPIKPKNSKPVCPRLKDPEGFILAIAKNKGDVKYWSCPQRGCKVSAKTFGFNLEWISGKHHHAPTIHGNTKVMQDIKLAKKQATPGNNTKVWNIDATFVKGKIGGTLLKDPFGFLLDLGKKSRTQRSLSTGGRIYWRCKTHFNEGCKASAITQGFNLEQTSGKHCHA